MALAWLVSTYAVGSHPPPARSTTVTVDWKAADEDGRTLVVPMAAALCSSSRRKCCCAASVYESDRPNAHTCATWVACEAPSDGIISIARWP